MRTRSEDCKIRLIVELLERMGGVARGKKTQESKLIANNKKAYFMIILSKILMRQESHLHGNGSEITIAHGKMQLSKNPLSRCQKRVRYIYNGMHISTV